MNVAITSFLVLNLALPGAEPLSPPDQLSTTMRTLLLQNLPAPLYESQKDWGKTKDIRGVRFRNGRAVVVPIAKNDGHWRKVRVDAINPQQTLTFQIRDLASNQSGVLSFTLYIGMDVDFHVTQQHWENGIKLYGASVRGRTRMSSTLKCEVTTKADFKNGLPEFACRAKVLKADVAYDNLVIEHVAGLGGDAAKLIGQTGHELIHQWKPSIERDLLHKANQAVTKAIEKKEIRIGFGQLSKLK